MSLFKRCRTCCMTSLRPDSAFVDGECTACIAYRKRREIDWDARKKSLLEILDRHDGRALVASSGGKDSHFIALKLIELGADVTIVTATTDDLSPIGKRNIRNLARYAPTIEITPNQTVRRKIARYGLRTVGDISFGEHMAIWATPFRVALMTGHTLCFYGENPQNEISGPVGTDEAIALTRRWQAEFGGLLGLRANDLVGHDGITEKDMEPYRMPDDTEKVAALFLGQFLQWDGLGNAVYAREHGFEWYHEDVEASIGRYESLDNHQTGVHEWFKFLKYRYMRPTDIASLAVRRERMTRSEALELIAEREVFPWTYLGKNYLDILEDIGVSPGEFSEICRKFTNLDLFDTHAMSWCEPRPKVFAEAAE